jgi:hypothetical protein
LAYYEFGPLLVMPRYFFRFNSEKTEEHGEDLPNDDAARRMARTIAEEMGCNSPSRPDISIYNEAGELIDPAPNHLTIDFMLPTDEPATRH